MTTSTATITHVLSDRERVILRALKITPQSAILFCERRNLYPNSWCPNFTMLRKVGFIERTGEMQTTSRGGKSSVFAPTRAGLDALLTL